MANKYLSASAGTRNWSDATGTWVTTSGGATATTAPTTSDVAILNASSGNVTIDATTNVAQQLNCANYTGTINSSSAANILTITTNVTMPATVAFGATAFRLKVGAGTATINIAATFPWDFEWSGTGTKTISTNVTISGITYMSASPTINGNTWYAVGGIEATTATSRIWYGSTNVEIQGGRWYYITKRTGGVVILNGNVTIESGYATSTIGLYDATLRYTSGTITVATDTIFNINGTSTIESNVGSNIIFQHLDATGTVTINSDIYIAKKLSCIGTTSWTINGAYTIHFGYGGSANSDLIMYNLGTFISTTAKLSFEGASGTLFSGTSYSSMTFHPLSALQIDLDINSPGTATFNNGSSNQWGGGRTLTHVAGAYTVSGCTWYVTTGGYTFNVNNAVTVPTFQNTTTATLSTAFTATTMTLDTGSTTNAVGNLTVTTLRMDGSAVLNKPNDATVVNVKTNFYQNGTDALTPTIAASPINLTEFVAGRGTQMNNSATAGSYYRMVSTTSFDDVTDFTFAFDYVHPGYTNYKLLGGSDGYFWFPFTGSSGYFFMTPGDAYYFYLGGASSTKRRIVITKASGSAIKFYVDGVSKSVSIYGSSSNLINADINFSNFAYLLTGDFLFFSGTAKDTTWVADDYAAFQANGNSSSGVYDNTEADLTAGWHVDQFTDDVTSMNFKYDGTLDNEQLFQSDFRYVDASTSAVPIRTMFGSVVSSNNVFANTLQDIGGGGVSVTHY